MSEKIDVAKLPVRMTGKCDPKIYKPGGDKYAITVLGESMIVTDDQAIGYLIDRLNRRFGDWYHEVEAKCNEGADMILADMCKDSVAYQTGYEKGADVLAYFIRQQIDQLIHFASTAEDKARHRELLALTRQLAALVLRCRKLMPAADPDKDGFRDR